MAVHELKLQALIDKAIDEHAKTDPDNDPRDYIGASVIGTECERAIWYGFRWYDQPKFPPRIRRRFETGHAYEPRVIARLRQAGFTVKDINPTARNPKKQFAAEHGRLGGLLRGHMDGIVTGPTELWTEIDVPVVIGPDEPVLLEAKAMASAKYNYAPDDKEYLEPISNKADPKKAEGRWFRLKRLGAMKEQLQHYAQNQTYMGLSHVADRNGNMQWEKWGLSGPIKHALYVGVNSDTDQWYSEFIPFKETWWNRILERATRIIRATVPPDRISDNPASWSCTFCDFHAVCHESSGVPKPSCRSCVHSQLLVPGDDKYYGTTASWLCNKHKSGCGDFKACADWTAIKDEEVMF
jgi:hypothetical protein